MADAFGEKVNEIVLNLVKGTNATAPTSLWVALYEADPGDEGDAGEIATGAYARVEIEDGEWSALVEEDGGERITNTVVVQFPDPTAAYTAAAVALKSASTAGDTWFHGLLRTPVTVENGGAPIVFPIGTLKLGSGT